MLSNIKKKTGAIIETNKLSLVERTDEHTNVRRVTNLVLDMWKD